MAGLLADKTRTEASNSSSKYTYNIPLKHLADTVAVYVCAYTQNSAVRHFGYSFILQMKYMTRYDIVKEVAKITNIVHGKKTNLS